MAKTIKFNLICDDKPVRNIEDLQNNFSIEDVLEYYHTKLLHRWLNVRGYEKQLSEIESISETEDINIAKKLIQVFEVEQNFDKLSESVCMLEYQKEKKELYSIYEKDDFKVKSIIDDHHAGYTELVTRIITNPDDFAVIKSAISEMVDNYYWEFNIDHRRLFYSFLKVAPLAVFLFLTNGKSRDFFLPKEIKEASDSTETEQIKTGGLMPALVPTFSSSSKSSLTANKYDIELPENIDKKDMYNQICGLIGLVRLKEILKDHLKSFAGITDGYWKDLEPKGNRFMILSMDSGDYVRAAGENGGDKNSDDVNYKFLIVDGIDYKSNNTSHNLLYMEV